MEKNSKVLVIGGGLAGTEAAFFLASHGIRVVLVEAKRENPNPAQKMEGLAELVCTNSLKSENPHSGHGLLKNEMRGLGSLILKVAEETSVPAGDALAVDREKFSQRITQVIEENQLIEVLYKEVFDPFDFAKRLECGHIILATGPLTTEGLEKWMGENLSKEDLYFYDAIAPVVDGESLDYSKLYFKDRYRSEREGEEGEDRADYLNAPLNRREYEDFISALVEAEKVPARNFEDYKFFESCLPIDIMAERGVDTPRFSCMKPVGLERADGTLPYACVQLRKENLKGSAFNLVGFQTRLKYPEQIRVFRMIPGLERANFFHLGSVHRNTFLNGAKLFHHDFSSKKFPNLSFAGQITGVEGYTESASMGLYVASQILRKIYGLSPLSWPLETAIGALVHYVMTRETPAPSNINFGLLPTVTLTKEQRRRRKGRKRLKKELVAQRGREVFEKFLPEIFPKDIEVGHFPIKENGQR